MRIFFIRHGETVDNVANLYAGTRDSALTVHGLLQAQRLAKSLTESGLRFTSIFSSDLERARKTADAICVAQVEKYGKDTKIPLQVTILPLLREQDFGIYEGKPFSARSRDSSKFVANGKKEAHVQVSDLDRNDVESKESMGGRVNDFLDEYLVPTITREINDETSAVAVVSHGILLSHLWRGFLQLLPLSSVALSRDLVWEGRGEVVLEHLGGWANTGYLELVLNRTENITVNQDQPDGAEQSDYSIEGSSTLLEKKITSKESLDKMRVTIMAINGKDHLKSLKRTRGGVGSSKQEDGQTTLEAFFKKRKL